MQVIVVHAVLVVLEGDHGQGEGPHAARAPVGQPDLQADGVAHPAGRRLAVTGLAVHQHVCKGHKTRVRKGRPLVCTFIRSLTPSPTKAAAPPPLCQAGGAMVSQEDEWRHRAGLATHTPAEWQWGWGWGLGVYVQAREHAPSFPQNSLLQESRLRLSLPALCFFKIISFYRHRKSLETLQK